MLLHRSARLLLSRTQQTATLAASRQLLAGHTRRMSTVLDGAVNAKDATFMANAAAMDAQVAEVRQLAELLDWNDISLRATYIRSAANFVADAYSRLAAPHDYALSGACFERAPGLVLVKISRNTQTHSAHLAPIG